MKATQILFFFLSLFLILFGIWYFWPAGGFKIGGLPLRFPSYESYLSDLRDPEAGVDVDSVLLAVQRGYAFPQASEDTLDYYRNYFSTNPNRIYLPDDDYTFFDTLFSEMEEAARTGRVLRFLHYGDSQLEMDRISSVLRQRLQERFGGSGPGMVPMIQRIPAYSVIQSFSGDLTRYAMVGDSLTNKASHKRYGPLTQFTAVRGAGSFSFRRTRSRYAQLLAREISRVSVLLGQNSPGFTLTLKCDTLDARVEVLDSARAGVSLISWKLLAPVERGTIHFNGDAEIYGILLDGPGGVTVDNVALRGSPGYIFSSIQSSVMRESFEKIGTRLILMQFGGNAVPGISSKKGISSYVSRIVSQFDYFRKVAPKAKLLFVGPTDMCKSVDGDLVTWPLLPELNDSLKANCLKHGVAYWDTFGMMGGVGSMKQWVKHSPPLAGPDHVHFTTKGAEYVGDALSKSFLVCYDFYQARKNLSKEAVRNYLWAERDSLQDRIYAKTDSLR